MKDDENGKLLMDESKIKGRWEKYFEQVVNEQHPRAVVGDEIPNHAIKAEISKVKKKH